MRVFTLTELQANAILDTRLRSLRKLEEMELTRELDELTGEKADIEALLGSEAAQWKTVAAGPARGGLATPRTPRRTPPRVEHRRNPTFADAF